MEPDAQGITEAAPLDRRSDAFGTGVHKCFRRTEAGAHLLLTSLPSTNSFLSSKTHRRPHAGREILARHVNILPTFRRKSPNSQHQHLGERFQQFCSVLFSVLFLDSDRSRHPPLVVCSRLEFGPVPPRHPPHSLMFVGALLLSEKSTLI